MHIFIQFLAILIVTNAYAISVVDQSIISNSIVNVDQKITVTFDEDIVLGSEEVILLNENDRSVPITIEHSGSTLTVSPIGGLNYSKNYHLSIDLIESGSGQQLEETFTLDFVTGRRSKRFFIGGVIIDGVINALYSQEFSTGYLFTSLTTHGMKNFRLGTTTQINPRLETEPVCDWNQLWDNNYWSSREFNTYILENAGSMADNNSVFLFLSGKSTHAGKYDTENEWDVLNNAELLVAIENHARETAQYFVDKGVIVHQYEIGNEVDFGIAGFYLGNRGIPVFDVVNDIETSKSELWVHHIDVFNAAITGIKSVTPSAKIAIHLAGMGYSPSNNYPIEFFRYMVENNVDFDVVGLSYPYLSISQPSLPRPYFKSDDFMTLMKNLSALEKEIQISEFSYHYNSDGVENTPSPDYPTTPEGQGKFIVDFFTELATYPKVSGAYYFYPDYFSNMHSYPAYSIGFYSTPTQEQPALDAIQNFYMKTELGSIPGDMNGDGVVGLEEAINALRIVSGSQ